jgi:ABC-type Zn uptake system ZnuABC Zn-binding protein ZnuA
MDLLFSIESNGIKVNFLSNNETSNPASTVALSSGVSSNSHKENTIGRDLVI